MIDEEYVSHYFVTSSTNLNGVVRSAKIAYENSKQHAVIHKHKMGQACNDECEPYPVTDRE